MKLYLLLFAVACIQQASTRSISMYEGRAIHIQKYTQVEGGEQQVIEFDQNMIHELFDHPEVKDRKIVAFSIIGAYRRGKSFFLDYCLRFLYANYKSVSTLDSFDGPTDNWMGDEDEPLTGFSWRPGRKADTNGILFWSDIFLYDAPNGDKIAILLMDTQGLFEPGVSSDLNARIFGLSTLISSIQVINLSGVIQEDQLQHLEMSIEFTKLVKKRNSTNSDFKPFQEMIFLVRDWADEDTGLGYEGGEIVWEEIQEASSKNKAAENVRKNIKNAFEKISTFLLPHPGLEVKKKHFNGSCKNLEKDFVKYLKEVIESIFAPKNLVVKKVFGKEIVGSDFKDLIVWYFTVFNKNELPKIESIFAVTAYREMQKISDTLVEEYGKQMSSDVNFNEEIILGKLLEKNKNLKNDTLEKFKNTQKMGDETMEVKVLVDLDRRCQEIFEKIQKDVLVKYEEYQKHKEEIRNLNLVNSEEKQRLLEAANKRLLEKSNDLVKQEKKAREAVERTLVERARQEKEKSISYRIGHAVCSTFSIFFDDCD